MTQSAMKLQLVAPRIAHFLLVREDTADIFMAESVGASVVQQDLNKAADTMKSVAVGVQYAVEYVGGERPKVVVVIVQA